VDTKGAGRITAACHHAPAIGITADNKWPFAQGRIVALFHGGKKGVHVNVDNFSDFHGACPAGIGEPVVTRHGLQPV
jgi:hypothetical protein